MAWYDYLLPGIGSAGPEWRPFPAEGVAAGTAVWFRWSGPVSMSRCRAAAGKMISLSVEGASQNEIGWAGPARQPITLEMATATLREGAAGVLSWTGEARVYGDAALNLATDLQAAGPGQVAAGSARLAGAAAREVVNVGGEIAGDVVGGAVEGALGTGDGSGSWVKWVVIGVLVLIVLVVLLVVGSRALKKI